MRQAKEIKLFDEKFVNSGLHPFGKRLTVPAQIHRMGILFTVFAHNILSSGNMEYNWVGMLTK